MSKRILVLGPSVEPLKVAAWGDGVGGYSRKMSMYLKYYRHPEFTLVPCFHTVRRRKRFSSLAARLFVDGTRFCRAAIKVRPHGLHILGAYYTAIPREFLIVLLAKLLRIRVVYEIKGGTFVVWYRSTNPIFRAMTRCVIRWSTEVLAQGMPYVEFLRNELNKDAVYYPNFIPTQEIPQDVPDCLQQPQLRILFVGYAYRDKGVYELVEACRLVSEKVPVRLTIIGKADPEFRQWADRVRSSESFTLIRTGTLRHEKVLEHYADNDIYCYPSRHIGEGHNNSVNEAMMNGLVVVCSRAGFMEQVLADDRGFLLPGTRAEEIYDSLIEINGDRAAARTRATRGRDFVRSELTTDAAFSKLTSCYQRLCGVSDERDTKPPNGICDDALPLTRYRQSA